MKCRLSPDFLHPVDEMEEGPISSDMKCKHCWDTEKNLGRLMPIKRKEKKL